jgi:hypothetical protein
MTDQGKTQTISILGGTGKEGQGLAYRWAKAGYRVLIGSRSPEKAVQAASGLLALLPQAARIEGLGNEEAARLGDILVLTVPYAAHRSTIESIQAFASGKLLVDVTVPLVPPKVTKVQMPAAGSAALEARQLLGDACAVTTAFQNISHELLLGDQAIVCDVLVTGSGQEARQATLELVRAAGLRGWDAGPLENSMVVEGLTSLLIHINKHYGSQHAGLRITGVAEETQP